MISDIVRVGIHLGKKTRFEWEDLTYFPFFLFAVFLFLARQNTKVPKGTPATDIALKSVLYSMYVVRYSVLDGQSNASGAPDVMLENPSVQQPRTTDREPQEWN